MLDPGASGGSASPTGERCARDGRPGKNHRLGIPRYLHRWQGTRFPGRPPGPGCRWWNQARNHRCSDPAHTPGPKRPGGGRDASPPGRPWCRHHRDRVRALLRHHRSHPPTRRPDHLHGKQEFSGPHGPGHGSHSPGVTGYLCCRGYRRAHSGSPGVDGMIHSGDAGTIEPGRGGTTEPGVGP